MDKLQEQLNTLMEQVDDLETSNNEWETKYKTLEDKLSKFEKIFEKHTHNNLDGSKFIENYIPKIAEQFDVVEIGEGSIFNGVVNGSSQTFITAGIPSSDPLSSGVDLTGSQLGIANFGLTAPSLLFGMGNPLIQFINTTGVNITSGGDDIGSGTLTIPGNDALAGCLILIMNTAGDTPITSKIISGNSTSSIEIHGTWGVNASDVSFLIYRPMQLGNAFYRWRTLSLAGQDDSGTGTYFTALTMGLYGAAQGIHFGSGAPPSGLGTQGSMYLRRDGSTTTTLYVKTGASTWTAK